VLPMPFAAKYVATGTQSRCAIHLPSTADSTPVAGAELRVVHSDSSWSRRADPARVERPYSASAHRTGPFCSLVVVTAARALPRPGRASWPRPLPDTPARSMGRERATTRPRRAPGLPVDVRSRAANADVSSPSGGGTSCVSS
jgi:hypothetical protein